MMSATSGDRHQADETRLITISATKKLATLMKVQRATFIIRRLRGFPTSNWHLKHTRSLRDAFFCRCAADLPLMRRKPHRLFAQPYTLIMLEGIHSPLRGIFATHGRQAKSPVFKPFFSRY